MQVHRMKRDKSLLHFFVKDFKLSPADDTLRFKVNNLFSGETITFVLHFYEPPYSRLLFVFFFKINDPFSVTRYYSVSFNFYIFVLSSYEPY